MPLQGDQRALLQLLCERGQSYEDIAGLLGGSVEDVQAKARAALTELGGADPDAEVGLTDYLLGQADPIGRADAVRYLQGNPESLDLATRIQAELREIAPAASQPKLPEPRGKPRRAAVVPAGEGTPSPAGSGEPSAAVAGSSGGGGSAGSSSKQTRLIAAIAGGGVVLLLVILAVAGVFSSDEEPSGGSATTASADGGTDSTAPEDQTTVTKVALKPVGDSGVAGDANFGIVGGSQLYVDLVVDGLDPKAPRDATYFIWLMIGRTGGYPLNQPLEPDANGRFSGRIAVPAAVAATVAGQADSVKISLSPVRDLAAAAKQAAEEQVPIVPFTGDELANGKIPLVDPEG